ncbi:MAG: PHP domain-containing protein [Chloroflexota bacterium]
MGEVDLHLHTNASDGRLTPQELVRLAVGRGLKVIAITDHDTTDGVRPAQAAAAKSADLRVIPGVELSVDIAEAEVHLLGYWVDLENREFQRLLAWSRDGRVNRARQILDRLAELGMPVDWERVRELAGGGAIGRPHIAQAMVEKGYVADIRQAFELYLGRGRPAYVERERLSPEQGIRSVLAVGGLPVLAHPAEIAGLEELLPGWVAAGLAGIEVYYAGYTPDVVARLLGLADRYGLVPTGGSDYHGFGTPDEALPGTVDVPREVVDRLVKRRFRLAS